MPESMRARLGEPKCAPFRTNRFFLQNNGWFFNTREGVAQGPFNTREQAEGSVSQYVERQQRRAGMRRGFT